MQLLEERVGLTTSDIANMSEEELDAIIEGQYRMSTSDQLKEARLKVERAHQDARLEYLKGTTGIVRWINGVLYSLNIKSPEKDLEKKKGALIKLKAMVDKDTGVVRAEIENGYQDIVEGEKRKLAIDIKISRREQAFDEERAEYERIKFALDEELGPLEESQLECELHETYMNTFALGQEINSLKANYVLTHERGQRIASILASEENSHQRLVQTGFDLELQIQEINLLMKKGVSPVKILGSMEEAYGLIERSETIKHGMLSHLYHASEALAEVRVVTGAITEENNALYRRNAEVAVATSDTFQLKYAAIKSGSG